MSEPLDTTAIRARAEAATDAPWRAERWTDHLGTRDVISGGHGNYEVERLSIMRSEDADFTAHARTDVPALCDALDEARQETERLARWKVEALPVLSGLQDLGKALGLPIGTLITGEEAAMAARRLAAQVEAMRGLSAQLRDPTGKGSNEARAWCRWLSEKIDATLDAPAEDQPRE